MATRTFCDHCGSTVRDPKVLSFGDMRSRLARQSEQEGLKAAIAAMRNDLNVGKAYAAAAMQNVNKSPAADLIPVIDVDLCPRCVPLWLERVRNLCKASDPEEKSDV
jgi:hypothetical protein